MGVKHCQLSLPSCGALGEPHNSQSPSFCSGPAKSPGSLFTGVRGEGIPPNISFWINFWNIPGLSGSFQALGHCPGCVLTACVGIGGALLLDLKELPRGEDVKSGAEAPHFLVQLPRSQRLEA